jgi:hypothetical protein
MTEHLDLDLAIRKLVNDPTRATTRRLWKALPAADRARALELSLASDSGTRTRNDLCREIAKARHFRVDTVRKWNDAHLAGVGGRIDLTWSPLIERAIIAFHLGDRADLLAAFLDELEVPHEKGRPTEEFPEEPFVSQRLVAGAKALQRLFDGNHVAVYLLALRLLHSKAFANVAACLHELFGGTGERVVDLPPMRADDPEQSITPTAPTFTTLDQRLILSVIDCVAGIEGAPSRDEVDDMLGELEALNGRRHRTFFHVGLRDAMFEQPPRPNSPSENQSRRWWYWAGFVSGLERRSRTAEIVALFDDYPGVRTLAEAVDGPSQAAASIVFKSLISQERVEAASAFITVGALAQSEDLRAWVNSAAIALIRHQRAADALVMVEKLAASMTQLPAGEELDERTLKALERRRALCLRQLGRASEAEQILKELAEDHDPIARAIARTDLGLIRAGKRRLGDLTLPRAESQLAQLEEELSRGEADFRAGLQHDDFKPAHASFALGTLELVRENYDNAVTLLDIAHTHFAGEDKVYSLDGTLALSELYLGLALCLSLDEVRFRRSGELIRSGLRGGAKLPPWMIRHVITALSLVKSDLVADTATEMLNGGDESSLDQLVALAPALEAPAVRSALFARAANPARPVQLRCADYRLVLPSLLKDGDVDRACDALAFIEEAGLAGHDPEKAVIFLQEAANFDPAWTPDRAAEARLAILESIGRFEDAAAEAAALCYRLLNADIEHGVDWAILLLEMLEGWGPAAADAAEKIGQVVEARLRQRDDSDCSDASAQSSDRNYDIRVLVVGGSEAQQRIQAAIVRDVGTQYPNVTIEFLSTGWSGNWRSYADEFTRRVAKVDAVVFLSLMRTMLSRTIHERCVVPWRGCRGKGRGEIVTTIGRVVPMARAQLRRSREQIVQVAPAS